MTFKYQDQIERVSFPNCSLCLQIKEMINEPDDGRHICGRMGCSQEFWFFKDKTNSSKMAILGLTTRNAVLTDGAIYHPDTTVAVDTVFTVLTTKGPTGDTYSIKDIIQPLVFEATRHIQHRLVILSTDRYPWLQLDEAAKAMAEVGFYRTLTADFKTTYVKYPLGSLAQNVDLAPEHYTGLEFGYGEIIDTRKIPGFSIDETYADQSFRKPTKLGDKDMHVQTMESFSTSTPVLTIEELNALRLKCQKQNLTLL
ncbi:hypothetical protein [uncultured Duncaniella sp.]|uniref:hypothetical protein n=1 Tax=uncultured Duncaniella sp. TaxID=2768039 RepID=UPI0026337013|nr:hypothetical protein [uncultured Duncaniella sp.]